MSTNSPESTLNAVAAQSPRSCHRMKIPLELRDNIYEMFLTTAYCTEADTKGSSLEFHLHIGILLVNKEISCEAKKVLYHQNDFIILTETSIRPAWVLKAVTNFKLLSEDNIPSPVLRVDVSVADLNIDKVGDTRTLITITHGLQAIISTLWKQQQYMANSFEGRNLSLALNFNLGAAARHRMLTELVLEPWLKINRLKELLITGHIKESTRERLQKSKIEGPLPHDLAMYLTEYDCLAELEFDRGNYNAARCWLALSKGHWNYVANLRPHRLGGLFMCELDDELLKVLQETKSMYSEGMLKLVKASLRQSRYRDAAVYLEETHSTADYEYTICSKIGCTINTPLIHIKLQLSDFFAQTGLGEHEADNRIEYLRAAARMLRLRRSDSMAQRMKYMSLEEIMEELYLTIDNELIKLKSPWRCGSKTPLSPEIRRGPGWNLTKVSRSFWEWMKLPKKR